MNGFDFSRDALGSKEPKGPTLAEVMKDDMAAKPKVMAMQKALLEKRYDLKAKLDPKAKMLRGKPLAVGPDRASAGRHDLGDTGKDACGGRFARKSFSPILRLPHPKHAPGGMLFPQIQIAMFPRLERFDIDFDLPDEFLPEFPPAIFLRNRQELGDVSRGEVVSINNFHRLFKDIVTPVQLDGLRLLVTPLPQEEFNLDRGSQDRCMPVWE